MSHVTLCLHFAYVCPQCVYHTVTQHFLNISMDARLTVTPYARQYCLGHVDVHMLFVNAVGAPKARPHAEAVTAASASLHVRFASFPRGAPTPILCIAQCLHAEFV